MDASKTPESFMRRAIELSAGGFPAPNPHVGCVIVKDGRVVGEGFHEYAGGPHAEVVALQAAGSQARGATAYVTLEPCNHTGRTGPCSEALIDAGIAEVVYAVPDPNPRAMGGGEKLSRAGVKVAHGLLENEARAENELFLEAMALQRPVVVLKAAMSLDGRIALASGESKWITSEAAREAAHRLRAECGCVLVGAGTVQADDPQLTARLGGVVNQPLRVVLDPEGKLSGTKRVFDSSAETLHVVANQTGAKTAQLVLPVVNGSFPLQTLLDELWSRKCIGVLVEGGALTIGSFLKAKLADRIELFIAPKVLGEGKTWVSGVEIDRLQDTIQGQINKVKRVGPDLHLSVQIPRQ